MTIKSLRENKLEKNWDPPKFLLTSTKKAPKEFMHHDSCT